MSTYNLRNKKQAAASSTNTRANQESAPGKFSIIQGRSNPTPGPDDDVRGPGTSTITRAQGAENAPTFPEIQPPPDGSRDESYASINNKDTTGTTLLTTTMNPSNHNHGIRSKRTRVETDESGSDDCTNWNENENCVHTLKELGQGNNLNREQHQVVIRAESNMTPEESRLVNQRNENLGIGHRDESGGHTTRTSTKGKGPDPRNWGALSIPQDELDFGNQVQALKEIKRDAATRQRSVSTPISDEVRNRIKRITSKSKNSENKAPSTRSKSERNLLPSNQVDPKSYLGKALKHARFESKSEKTRKTRKSKKRRFSRDYDNDPDPSTSEDDYEAPESSQETSNQSDGQGDSYSSSDPSSESSDPTESTGLSQADGSETSTGNSSGTSPSSRSSRKRKQ